jgi:hypothetical protein
MVKFVWVLGLLFIFCFVDGQTTEIMPGTDIFKWKYDSPQNQGLDAEAINLLVDNHAANGTKKLLIIKNDK